MPRKKPKQLAATKLDTSALDLDDAKELGIEILSPTKTKQLFPMHAAAALKFNYYDANGKLRKDIYRVRLLEVVPGAFGEVPDKPLRYLQPPDSVPGVYFPRSVNWAEILNDTNETIIITEGELKAACACKFGFPTIGLGGVWSWRSNKLGWGFLPELELIEWVERDVVIVFDSDATTNPGVSSAIAALVNELDRRGAMPRVAELPDVDQLKKTGLDDYLVVEGSERFSEVLEAAECDDLATQLWQFNARFSVILDPGVVHDDEKGFLYSPEKFRSYLFANIWADKQVPSPDGTRIKHVKVATEWLDWPLRKQYNHLTYQPGQPKIIDDHVINEWQGWGVKATKNTIKPWAGLLNHLFTGAGAPIRQWFECWCLWPLRHPGTKLLSATGIWSRPQGVGKSLVGFTLGRLYGDNYSLISQRELESDFNSWAAKKQFVMIDDISAHDSRSKADILKKMITQEELQVNIKYMPTYVLPDVINYYLTSNRSNAFFIEDQDRRFFIHEVTVEKLAPEFYTKYHTWLNGVGPAALLYHALHDFDFGTFSPFLPPPVTEAKLDMIDSVRTELDLWLVELRNDPAAKLRLGSMRLERDLWTSAELVELFEQHRKGKACPPNTMGLRLREYFKRAADGNTIRPNDRSERFYIIRNETKWLGATRNQLKKHIQDHRERERGSSGKKY